MVSLLVATYAIARLGTGFMSSDLRTEVLFIAGGMAVYTIVGALIEDRRPGHPIGRICLATGLTMVASLAFRGLAEGLDREPGALPPVGALAAVVSQMTTSALVIGSLLLISRFPDGRAVGLLGRTANWNIVLLILTQILLVLQRGPLNVYWVGPAPSPIGFLILPSQLVEVTAYSGILGLGIGLLAGAAALIARYRTGSALAKAQIRWLFAAISISGILLGIIIVAPDDPALEWVWTAWIMSFLLAPIAVGIAITRYRLYDIDRIISRTVGYALITGTLASTLVALILVLGGLLARFAEGQTIAVAASTLAAFALLQPVRGRIQRAVDRRFDRASFDAELTVAGFAGRLRVNHDLESVRAEIVDTTATSVRPTRAAVWIRNMSS